jgi:hypothetical protein
MYFFDHLDVGGTLVQSNPHLHAKAQQTIYTLKQHNAQQHEDSQFAKGGASSSNLREASSIPAVIKQLISSTKYFHLC